MTFKNVIKKYIKFSFENRFILFCKIIIIPMFFIGFNIHSVGLLSLSLLIPLFTILYFKYKINKKEINCFLNYIKSNKLVECVLFNQNSQNQVFQRNKIEYYENAVLKPFWGIVFNLSYVPIKGFHPSLMGRLMEAFNQEVIVKDESVIYYSCSLDRLDIWKSSGTKESADLDDKFRKQFISKINSFNILPFEVNLFHLFYVSYFLEKERFENEMKLENETNLRIEQDQLINYGLELNSINVSTTISKSKILE